MPAVIRVAKKIIAFSLMELMVVIAIIAILAATAIPSYMIYLQRASLAEAVSALAEYKTAIGVFWSVNGSLPTTGDTLISTPADLPFGTSVTTNLPNSIQSITLTSAGSGILIRLVVQANIFSSFSISNRSLFLGAKAAGRELLFVCGNYSTNASASSDLGFTNLAMLPNGCNYNGVGAWLI